MNIAGLFGSIIVGIQDGVRGILGSKAAPAPLAAPPPGPSPWIGVQDRTPEVGSIVLVSHPGLIGPGVTMAEFGDPRNGHPWQNCFDDKLGVTHWMPLPEPPR